MVDVDREVTPENHGEAVDHVGLGRRKQIAALEMPHLSVFGEPYEFLLGRLPQGPMLGEPRDELRLGVHRVKLPRVHGLLRRGTRRACPVGVARVQVAAAKGRDSGEHHTAGGHITVDTA
jgi:hypothetical protein